MAPPSNLMRDVMLIHAMPLLRIRFIDAPRAAPSRRVYADAIDIILLHLPLPFQNTLPRDMMSAAADSYFIDERHHHAMAGYADADTSLCRYHRLVSSSPPLMLRLKPPPSFYHCQLPCSMSPYYATDFDFSAPYLLPLPPSSLTLIGSMLLLPR